MKVDDLSEEQKIVLMELLDLEEKLGRPVSTEEIKASLRAKGYNVK